MSVASGLAMVGSTHARARRILFRTIQGLRGRLASLGGRRSLAFAGVPIKRVVRSVLVKDLNCLDNFYGLETDGQLTWRWTGPGSSFTVVAQIDRSAPVRAVLEVQDSPSAINWANTFIECDGVMALCRHSRARGRHFLSGTLPARSGPASALIRYHIQESRPPAGGQDGRRLGLRVGALHFATD